MQAFFQAANNLYLARKELWEVDFGWEGFQWLEADDANANTVSFLRKAHGEHEVLREGVHKGEGQVPVVVLPEVGVQLDVVGHIVHPAHVLPHLLGPLLAGAVPH